MKKTIFVAQMIDCKRSIAYWQDMAQEAEKAYTRKRSEKGRKQAQEEIDKCKNLVENYQEKLDTCEKKNRKQSLLQLIKKFSSTVLIIV